MCVRLVVRAVTNYSNLAKNLSHSTLKCSLRRYVEYFVSLLSVIDVAIM